MTGWIIGIIAVVAVFVIISLICKLYQLGKDKNNNIYKVILTNGDIFEARRFETTTVPSIDGVKRQKIYEIFKECEYKGKVYKSIMVKAVLVDIILECKEEIN